MNSTEPRVTPISKGIPRADAATRPQVRLVRDEAGWLLAGVAAGRGREQHSVTVFAGSLDR